MIVRERYANSSYGKVSEKFVLFEDGKIMHFLHPSAELILAEPGDTIVYQTDGVLNCRENPSKFKVKFKL